MKIPIVPATCALCAGIFLSLPSRADTVIYQDDFNASGLLHGRTPVITTGSNNWSARTSWAMDGSSLSNSVNAGLAYLPFTPEPGRIYELTATMKSPGVATGATYEPWNSLGFAQSSSPSLSSNFANASVAGIGTVIFRCEEGVRWYEGPNVTGATTTMTPVGTLTGTTFDPDHYYEFRLVLNTFGDQWKMDLYIDGVQIDLNGASDGLTHIWAANPTIRSVVLSSISTDPDMRYDSFKLSSSADPIRVSDFNLPPQDANGWSVLTPATDSLLIYVDPVNGDDSTAVAYSPTDIGGNPQSPVAPPGGLKACETIAAATALARTGQPDWVLLKAGSVFVESLTLKNGRSPSERAVVCAYGTGARPELRTGVNRAITNTFAAKCIVSGIKFWAHTRDPLSPDYTGATGSTAFSLSTYNPGWYVHNILLEDCIFRSYISASLSDDHPADPPQRFAIRRCLFSGNYSQGTGGHSQGLFYAQDSDVPVRPSVLLQENTFDQNGWQSNAFGGTATIYNHNTYFVGAKGTMFLGNHFLRGSSHGNKWTSKGEGQTNAIVIEDNLYAENEIGISIGSNYTGQYRFQNVRIRSNVMVDLARLNPIGRTNPIAWGLLVTDWKHGDIVDNLIAHQREPINNVVGIAFNAEVTPTASEDVWLSGNVIANFRGGTGTNTPLMDFRYGTLMANSYVADNIVQSPSATPLAKYTTGGYSFLGTNQYSSTAAANKKFVASGAFTDLAGWKAATIGTADPDGDLGAVTTAPVFNDPSRDIESYAATLGIASFDDFIAALYNQSKANWDPRLTAHAVNNYLRRGFNLEPVQGNDVADGLVARWSFDHNAADNAPTGGVADNGTATGSPVYGGPSSSTVGTGSLTLNGTSQYVTVANSADLSIASPMTISAWVKINSSTDNSYRMIVSKKTTYTEAAGYEFFYHPSLDLLILRSGGASVPYSLQLANLDLDTGWHHLAVTISGSTGTFYVDGVAQTSGVSGTVGNPPAGATPLVIGRRSGTTEYPWNGSLDDVRIYNRALSPHEIDEVYLQN